MTDDLIPSVDIGSIARPEVRRRLNQEVRTDSELDAFILDYFELTYREFAHGMNRTTKVNELFNRNNVEIIDSCLSKYIIDRRSNISLFKRIKKAGARKLKKLYIFLSIFFGVTFEYVFGPIGKLVKAIGFIAATSATVATGGVIIITYTDLVQPATVTTVNKHLGTTLGTPAMRHSTRSEIITKDIEINELKRQIIGDYALDKAILAGPATMPDHRLGFLRT